MGVKKEELNLMEIFQDLGTICLTEEKCLKCADRACMVGYSKDCAAQCRIQKKTYVEGGMRDMPEYDIRGGYDEYDVLHGISHLLLQCRSCREEHYEDCVINIIRSCLEAIEFGDNQEYPGDVVTYLSQIQDLNSEKAGIIAEEYTQHKEKKLNREA